MNVIAPFGFVTGCHPGDKFMVQATLASMRHYCPDVPICLVADNDVDVSDLQAAYDLHVVRTNRLPDSAMREICFGSYHAKMSAMWEGPFEFMVWMDSDAIVWGDFTAQIRTDVDFHILWRPEPGEKEPAFVSSPGFKHYFFDAEKLRSLDPAFDAQGHIYFCSGAFGFRRNAIPFEQWSEICRWSREDPEVFGWGEMGMLNYAVHSAAQRGQLTTAVSDLQDLWLQRGIAELEADCQSSRWRFPENISRPRIAHFCGRKPHLSDRSSYSKPFTIARLEHYRKFYGNLGSWLCVLREEWGVVRGKIRSRYLRLVKKPSLLRKAAHQTEISFS